MGLFPEIRRAWLISGNALYLWSFDNNRDFTYYLKSQCEIIDVALLRPKPGVFNESVEWVLVIVTPLEISLLAVVFKSPENSETGLLQKGSTKDYSSVDLNLIETGLIFPSDEVNMVSICGTNNGRIFAAGSDGNIYEFVYQDSTGWFSSKCQKINRTASPLSYIVPTFLRQSTTKSCVVKLIHDASRNIIYGLTEQSTIHLYWLGKSGFEFEFVGVTGDLSSEAVKLTPAGIISSSKALEVVSIHPVETSGSDLISLIAICRSGIRLYFSTIYHSQTQTGNIFETQPGPNSLKQAAPRGIRLAHLRAPPEENRVRDPKKLVHRWSPNIHCAFYSNGVTLAANTISNEEDLLLGMIVNPSVGSTSSLYRLPLEYSIEAAIDGKIWSIEELVKSPPLTVIETEFKGLSKEFALAHLTPRRSFAVLTNVGVYIYSKLRPVDQLFLLLSEQNISWEQLEKFFEAYGYDQACAFCISLCCRASSEARWDNPFSFGSDGSIVFLNNAISALLRFGSHLDLIDGQRDRNHQALFPKDRYKDGIGRIIATQPEFENSPIHEGFYIFFSRLVSSVWRRSLWDFDSVPGQVLIDLTRFYKFISENIGTFTEKRQLMNFGPADEELSLRHRNAVEFENESLIHLKETSGLLIELLTFLSICVDYKLLESLKSESIYAQNLGITVELLITSFKGRSLITEIGNTLVQKQLKSRAPIRPLCESLRSRCSSFFSEEDVFLQEGLEALERARLCRSPVERSENVIEALMALKKASKVLPVSNLHSVIGQLDILGFPDCSIMLGLHFIENMDPENVGLKVEQNPNFNYTSEEHEICHQRELIYERLMESISCTGFDMEKTSALSAANPSLDIKALREKCLGLASLCVDELFHYRLYDWLVKSRYSQSLLEMPPSEFLLKYLRNTFISREALHRDLLWKWLARSGRFAEAASVLATIAESREYSLTLSERIEYLSLAITHYKSASIDMAQLNVAKAGCVDGIHVMALTEIEELLEVAHAQFEVLKEARLVLGDRNDGICAELDGLVGLLTVSDLFNRYARPYHLTESCLRLIHISGLVNERLVSQLWQDIISKYIRDSSDISSFHRLGAKITELSRKFYPSPSSFPLAHLIDILGRLAMNSEIGADWLVAVFINSGIPLMALSDEFHRFSSSPPSKIWFNPPNRIYLLEMIAILFNFWIKDHEKVSANNPLLVSRIKTYSMAAEELHCSDLISEFGNLLKILASH